MKKQRTSEATPEPTRRPLLRRLLRALLRVLLALVVLSAVGSGAFWWWLQRNVLVDLPTDLSALTDHRPRTACQVLDASFEVVDRFYVERRIWVPLDELPSYLPQAFVAAEDRRFWEHPGVDLGGIARAFVINMRAGRTVQGGSTITQQLVKNLLVGQERSYERKMKEALLARRLERKLSKERILELYVNFVALGAGNYGVEAASRDYFGISARDVNPGQAAMLAGLVPAPSRYSPRVDPALATHRRELTLRAMVRDGALSAEEAVGFLDDPVLVDRAATREAPAAAYVTQVRREVRRLFGSELPFEAGLLVYTPLDSLVQQVAEAAIAEALDAHTDRQGARALRGRLPPDEWEAFLARAPGLDRDPATGASLPPPPGRCFEALVGTERSLADLRAGSSRLPLRKADRARTVALDGGAPPGPLQSVVQAGDILRVCEGPDGEVTLDDSPWAEGAAVVLENATGRVIALVGGRQVALEGFIRATQARRQPGSSFKPYVYATALLGGHSQLDVVVDAPLSMPAGGGRTWSPRNYGGKYFGRLPMRQALARSLNTVSVRLVLEQGAAEVARVARAMGVRTPLRKDPTIALGSSEVTPMDQALGYATIARLGVPTDPVWIDRLEDATGGPLGGAGDDVELGSFRVRLPGGPLPRALPPGVAAELTDMMREVVRAGTARRAFDPALDRAGKTGTTNGFLDAWFVGFTPRWTVAIWIGTDGTRSLGDGETGGRAALPAWIRIVAALPSQPGERIPMPPEAMLIPWEAGTVVLDRATAPRHGFGGEALPPGPLPPFPG